MKRAMVIAGVGLVILGASGCSGPDSLMREFLANLHLCADLIERKESREKIQRAIERANATADKLNREKLTPEQRDDLFDRYNDQLQAVKKRLEEAQIRWKLEGGEELPPLVINDLLKR
ncbi:MAG: hypothetical protein RMJ56_11785 [Gemmataceae bacterium]|nr:hypothetical protein [Gemmataceae bacterium]